MRFITSVVATTIVLAAGLTATSIADASQAGRPGGRGDATTIAVIGDTPYGQPQIDNFRNDIAELNADPDTTRVVHLGDIKNGSSPCTTDYFEQIRADFDLFDKPLVYTPGDNEWTDCHRANNGGYQPAGAVPRGSVPVPSRLDELRRIFFDDPGRTLGQPAAKVAVQAAPYRENVRWRKARTVFATLNIPGSNNDKAPWFGAAETSFQKQQQAAEVSGRTDADVRWLDAAFNQAERRGARAVVLGIQADMWDPAITSDPASYDGFTPIVKRLAARARQFRGPVLLLNGDSHQFTDDHPLADPAHPENRTIYGLRQSVPNLRRITVNGSTTSCHEWLKLHIAPNSSDTFSYQRVRFSKQPGFDPAQCPPQP